MRRILAAALAALTLVPAASAAGTRRKTSDPDAALYAAARREGSLVWYAIPLPYNKTVIAQFEKRYPGVTVTPLYAGGTQLIQRFKLEKAAGKEIDDCLSSGLTEAYPELRRQGWLAPLSGLPHWKQRPAWAKDPHGAYFYYANFRVVLMWNTDLVKPGTEPKSVAELIQPRWRGRVVMFDPTSAGVAVPLYRWVVQKLGLGFPWLKALRANGVLLANDAAQLDETVASGRRAVTLTRDTEAFGALQRGAPIAFRVPEEGSMLHLMPIAINARAPHPNAARLFVDWLLSDEGRAALASQKVGLPEDGEAVFKRSKAWALDAETVSPTETKSFVDSAVAALKGG
ncbi:MAG: extracellular solute-binding protein [Elusimicrobia bacterium]|nr:extracellular solute-binding protein [Elusimicrobiota bacterium]